MALPVIEIAKWLADNIDKTELPFFISKKTCSKWAEKLGIPLGGETIIYTSCLHQITPYIDSLIKFLERLEGKKGAGFLLKPGKTINRIMDVTKIASKVDQEKLESQYNILRGIANMLSKANVEFGYLYEDDIYSGVLLYDLGLIDQFKKHVVKVFNTFRKHGVKKVITVDPHTTHLLRSVYPQIANNFNIKVENYLEILANKNISPTRVVSMEVVIHDPCIYAFYEDIVEQPRALLAKAGVKILESDNSKKLTYCCGGPIESLSPTISKRIAQNRIKQLTEKGVNIITMCPFCYMSLSRVSSGDINITDISVILSQAYGG